MARTLRRFAGGTVNEALLTIGDLEYLLAKGLLRPGGAVARGAGGAVAATGRANLRALGGAANALLSNPYAMAATLGAAPFVSQLGKETSQRYNSFHKALVEAPYRKPGDMTVTASAREFIEKRAALQQNAAPNSPWHLGGPLVGSKGLLVGGSLAPLGGLTTPTLDEMGERVKRFVFPNMFNRMRLHEDAAQAFAGALGKNLAEKSVGLLGDILSKAVQAPANAMASRTRGNIFKTLQKEDEVLAQADENKLLEAYHTMTRFAPTLSTDKNAVKTFLREMTLYGNGPNFMTIKQLAEAERAVNESKGDSR